GNYAYVSDGAGGLTIIDISNPADPHKVSNIGAEHVIAYRLDVSGYYCYVAAQESLWVVNIIHPESPSVIGSIGWETISGWKIGRGVRVLGDYAYLNEMVRIIDISNPTNPVIVGEYFAPGDYRHGWDNKPVAVGDSLYCFYATDNAMMVLDVHDPTKPHYVGYCLDITPDRDSIPLSRGIDVISRPEGHYVYLVGENPGALCVFRVTGIATTGIDETPGVFMLLQNRPNPVLGRTEISYYLPDECRVELAVYDLTGRVVKKLVDGVEASGHNSVIWDGTDAAGNKVAPGVYFYKLEAGSYTAHKRLIMLK
ncbi:MAG: FlgD immunoglobulin-like domain containing protein, partial [bacterium]|nr:FlgD immunoglobulin-like domain containing protein [bacterium]